MENIWGRDSRTLVRTLPRGGRGSPPPTRAAPTSKEATIVPDLKSDGDDRPRPPIGAIYGDRRIGSRKRRLGVPAPSGNRHFARDCKVQPELGLGTGGTKTTPAAGDTFVGPIDDSTISGAALAPGRSWGEATVPAVRPI